MSDIKRDAEIGLRAGGWVPVAETDELRAEIERLQQKLADPCYTALWYKTEEAAQLRTEIERLRTALDAIARKPGADNETAYELRKIAREALGDAPRD